MGATIAEPWESKVAEELNNAQGLGLTFVSSETLLEKIGVPLDRQLRADTMKLSRAVLAAVEKKWKPARRMDSGTKIQKRGYELIGAPGSQPQKETPTSNGAWPDGRLDLNPMTASDLRDDAILANLFLERNKSNKEEPSSYLNTVEFQDGDLGRLGWQNAETDYPAIDLEEPTLKKDGDETFKVGASDANSHPADAFTESSWAISSESFVEVKQPAPVYFSGVNGAYLIGKLLGPDRDSDLMLIRTPTGNIVGCSRNDYTLEDQP